MDAEALQGIVETVARVHGLDPVLVKAVCDNESSWDQWSVRYEPGFYRKYVESLAGVSATEKTCRATSYGLMQVMGQVAREFGFAGKWLTELCDPVVGVQYGCMKLADCVKKTKSLREALLRYNGGGDAGYPDRVLSRMEKYSG